MTVNSIKDIMGAFFSTLAQDEQDKVWKNFLVNKGLDPTLTPAAAPSTYVSEFVDYAQGVYDRLLTEYNLSPDEVKKRQIMFMIFDLSLTMLKAIQNSIAVTANNMIISSKWQDEYTKMLTRVPIYTAQPSEKMRIDLTDPAKCTFGYNDINVQDMAQYIVNQANLSAAAAGGTTGAKEVDFAMSTEPNNTFEELNGNRPPGTLAAWIKISNVITTFRLHISPEDGKGYVEIQETAHVELHNSLPNPDYNFSGTKTLRDVKIEFDYSPTTSSDSFASTVKTVADDTLTVIKNSFDLTDPSNPQFLPKVINLGNGSEDFWFGSPSFHNALYNGDGWYVKATGTPMSPNGAKIYSNNFFIPWRYKQPYADPGTDTGQKDANKMEESHRAETNSLLQQYLETIRAKRQSVRDRATTLQSSLDQTRESMSQQSNLLTSIVDTMKDILGSIFR